jgi:hypothetical protein
MTDHAEQNFPSGDIKVATARNTESRADHRDKREYDQSQQVLAFPGQEISAIKHMSSFYLQSLHFYLQSWFFKLKNIKVISVNQIDRL